MAGGIMRMRPVTGGVALAPGATLTLAPGGAYHFMLIRPKRPLKIGDRVPATLTFAKAGAVKAVFVVQAQSSTGAAVR
jgi:copper(I)-binding protein